MNYEDKLYWFHGKISRERAEDILHEVGEGDGVFLVRESNTSNGDFVLSVLHQEQVWHYQIRRHGEDAFFSIDDHKKFYGLDSLIEHYQQSSNGLVTQLKAIVKQDLPPNDTRSHGKTNLLHRATKENNQTVVSNIVTCKYNYRNFDAKNQDGQTAIHLACIYSNEEILKLLIEAGANVNSRDTLGNTPLHYAARNKSASFIKTLINAKANIQNRNIETGYVPLHDAAKYGNMEAVEELLKAKAPHLPRTLSGEFPIDLAKENGHYELENFLKQYKPLSPETSKNQWYHGTLDRTEAIELITQFEINLKKKLTTKNDNNNQNKQTNDNEQEENNNPQKQILDTSGIFLVRYSNRSGYVLTLLCEGQPKNFIIQKQAKYLYIDEGPYLLSLEHLIQHYMIFSDGLPINLRYPVPPKPKPPLPLFSTMPKSSFKRQHKISKNNISDNHHHHGSNIQYSQHHIQRNFSHPPLNDSMINNVGLFETKDKTHNIISPTATTTTDKKKRDMHIFRSLKPRSSSTKKNIIIDGMKSLRKAKLSDNSNRRKLSNDEISSKNKTQQDIGLDLAESLIKNLSFSTDFLNQAVGDNNGFYNIPKNNCAVVEIDIGEGTSSNNNDDNKPSILYIDNSSKLKTDTAADIQQVDNLKDNVKDKLIDGQKSENTEFINNEDYFTKSDKEICDTKHKESYFVDAPSTDLYTRSNDLNCSAATGGDLISSTNFTGYVPTVDIRIFFENTANDENTTKILAESSAELREFSKHPERLDSVISTISTDSEFMGVFNRRTLSSTTTSSTDSNKVKLNYFIPSECLKLDDIIGEGEFGSVYKGSLKCTTHNENNLSGSDTHYVVVAIKTLRDEHCRTNKQEFLREASVMIQLQHHCIVKLIGISKGETLMMVQELVPLGSMLNYILNNPEKINPNYELKIWASQIACGMNYLESQHFVHRDLAARNILLASRHQIKISDFGLSRALSSGNCCYEASQGGKWPIKWYAPESFNHGYFSHASDVWSFGVTLWEMFSLGKPPYGDIRGVDAIKLIEKGHRLPKPLLCPDNVYAIMENCWRYNPKERPSFQYLTEYFSKDLEYQNLSELIQSEHIS